MKLIKVEADPVRKGNVLIFVRRGIFRKRIEEYTGSGTVFHRVPDGYRPGTMTEAWFAQVAWRFQNSEGLGR